MNKRVVIAIAALAAVFAISVAGASVLNLAGSDRAPGEGKTEAACAGNLTIQHPVQNGGHDNNRVVHVYVSGDMTSCEGETIRLEVDLADDAHAYATRVIGNNVTELTFTFDQQTGDFTDTAPTVVDGQLVQAGEKVKPQKAQDFGLVSVLIAQSFE